MKKNTFGNWLKSSQYVLQGVLLTSVLAAPICARADDVVLMITEEGSTAFGAQDAEAIRKEVVGAKVLTAVLKREQKVVHVHLTRDQATDPNYLADHLKEVLGNDSVEVLVAASPVLIQSQTGFQDVLKSHYFPGDGTQLVYTSTAPTQDALKDLERLHGLLKEEAQSATNLYGLEKGRVTVLPVRPEIYNLSKSERRWGGAVATALGGLPTVVVGQCLLAAAYGLGWISEPSVEASVGMFAVLSANNFRIGYGDTFNTVAFADTFRVEEGAVNRVIKRHEPFKLNYDGGLVAMDPKVAPTPAQVLAQRAQIARNPKLDKPARAQEKEIDQALNRFNRDFQRRQAQFDRASNPNSPKKGTRRFLPWL